MKNAVEKTIRYGLALSAITVVLMVTTGGVSRASAATGGNPCDTRDVCSAEPDRYAAYREESTVKALEYVADMNWTGGGPPASAVVPSRVVRSYDMAGGASCNLRDVCVSPVEARKVVRVGPGDGGSSFARGASGDRLAATPSGK